MIKMYMRQAWTLIKQNRLYSMIYIIGTGLSVSLIMIVFIIYYIKFAPIYPEYNRNKTMVFSRIAVKEKSSYSINNLSYHVGHDILPQMKHVKDIAMICPATSYLNDNLIRMSKGKENIKVTPLYVNDGYWRVFTFNFICGRPFTAADERAQFKKAVISESLAKKIFGSTDVKGRQIENNGQKYEISGVVEDVSQATPDTYADLWIVIPKSVGADADNNGDRIYHLMGTYKLHMTVRDNEDKKLLKDEIQQYFKKLNLAHKKDSTTFDIMGQPDTYIESNFRNNDEVPNFKSPISDFLVMMFALLFVPALNLCGMISSRMEGRMSEMGIRKAFGARRKELLRQILWENMILSSIGAILGLIFSYIFVITSSNWILRLFDTSGGEGKTTITLEMLFNPTIICIAISITFLLNIISAIIPALLSLRHGIIYSLSTKR